MYFIDSHCHLHDEKCFNPKEQQQILKNCQKNNVQKIICIGTDYQDSHSARDFCLHNSGLDNSSTILPQIFWSYGVHPSNHALSRKIPDFLDGKPVAIGEVGLDYHYGDEDKEQQYKLLEEMLDLAVKHNLPLIFHVREAFDDFFAIVDNFQNIRGVVHSFTDNKKNLKKALDRDFYIGVNGIATYSTLPLPPLDKILLETDAPFLAPVPHRGKKNSPEYIPDIATWLATKTDKDPTEIMNVTTQNTENLFKI